MPIILRYGTHWARNQRNFASLKGKDARDPHGVYVLCGGSMPVYVGRGRIWSGVRKHSRGIRSSCWDHFSWFATGDGETASEIEALLLRMLPFYLRTLNKRHAAFQSALRCSEADPRPIPIRVAKATLARKTAR